MKVLVDMNLSPRWIDLLNRFDIQATHWSSVGNPQAFDQEIMSHASEHGYIVLTNDLDFAQYWRSRMDKSRASYKSAPKISIQM